MRGSEITGAGRGRAPASRRARLAITVACGVLGLLAAACSGTAASVPGRQQGQSKAPAADGPPAQVSITPADGTANARPNHGVSVTVVHGTLRSVSVRAGRARADGTLSKTGTSWHTRWPLHTGTRYTVTATAAGSNGKTVTTTSSFRTLTPGATFTAQTLLGYHQTYGVGMPITITFSHPVTRKAAVEKAIEIKSSKPIVGAFMWDGDQSLSFRPRTYWPQHTKVSFTGHFNGVEAARGVYGTANLSQSFTIGNSLIVVASTRTHYEMVYYKNKLLGRWAISTGRPGDDTANGTYLTIEKANPTLMSGPGYHNFPVPYAVRFTWSGNYQHDAYWSVAEQGHINVSHGCVNLSPAHGQLYYNLARPGDPVTITGSPVAGAWDDGWTQWFWTWKQLLRHSATHLAVQAGPAGSMFVSPSTLPAPASTSVRHDSKPHNYLAR